ncbi:hypothetical protein WMY93_031296 [Mugilogobius chulae]|uniref:Fucolectin tachylectin-4 pentraxin-1 domain-containing protein n=1 Tax=Mugilogobius chulae TaxID=88201 RepID=A0AAW0MGL7_9GOBI
MTGCNQDTGAHSLHRHPMRHKQRESSPNAEPQETAFKIMYANVALGGTATQIDTFDDRGVASNAIDGNREAVYGDFTITSVTVVNRGDCCAHRLNGAQIRIGNSLENNGNNNPV